MKVVKIASDVTAEVSADQMLKTAVDESLAVIAAAKEGDLTRRVVLAGKTGPMETVSAGLNTLLDTTVVAFADIGRVLGALSAGDLSQRVTREYSGTFNPVSYTHLDVYKRQVLA